MGPVLKAVVNRLSKAPCRAGGTAWRPIRHCCRERNVFCHRRTCAMCYPTAIRAVSVINGRDRRHWHELRYRARDERCVLLSASTRTKEDGSIEYFYKPGESGRSSKTVASAYRGHGSRRRQDTDAASSFRLVPGTAPAIIPAQRTWETRIFRKIERPTVDDV
jgi:hypothetical protein